MSEANPTEASKLHCPECGGVDLVQAYMFGYLIINWCEAARCVTCGHRFRVSEETHALMRFPVWGEPYENLLDHFQYMLLTPMRAGPLIGFLVGFITGPTICAYLWDRYRAPFPIVFPFCLGTIYLGWWIGRRLQPPVERAPGKCPQCLYDLRGSAGPFCPECGRRIDVDGAGEAGREANENR